MNHRQIQSAALLGVALAGALLRLDGLDLRELSMDEAFSWRMTRWPLGEMLRRLGDDVHPPLYYVLLKAWVAAFGDSLASLMGLSAGFGVLTIFAAGALARRVVRGLDGPDARAADAAGLLAAVFVSLSPFQVAFSRTARMYSLGTFLGALSTWALLRALADRSGSRRPWVVYALTTSALLATHYYAAFTVAAQALLIALGVATAWSRGGLDVSTWRRAALALALALVLYGPWIPRQIRQMESVWQRYWIAPLTPQALRQLAYRFLTGLKQPTPPGDWVAFAWGATLLGALLRGGKREPFLLAALILAPWLGGVILAEFGQKTFVIERYLIFAHLFFLVALAVVLGRAPGAPRLGLAALVIACLALGLSEGREADDPWEPRGNLEDLVRALGPPPSGTGRTILICGAGEANQYLYYAGRAGLVERPKVLDRATSALGHQPYRSSVAATEWLPPRELATEDGTPLVVVQHDGQQINQFLERPARSLRVFSRVAGPRWHLIEY